MWIGCESKVGKQMPKIEVPDVIDVKIGSKVQAKWTEVLNRTEESIIADNINLRISNMIVKVAKEEIDKEEEIEKARLK